MSNSPEFGLCYEFFRHFDVLGWCTWHIFPHKIVILFYFNDENIDVDIMVHWLNLEVSKGRMLNSGWKTDFKIICTWLELWIDNFFKKVEFVLEK